MTSPLRSPRRRRAAIALAGALVVAACAQDTSVDVDDADRGTVEADASDTPSPTASPSDEPSQTQTDAADPTETTSASATPEESPSATDAETEPSPTPSAATTPTPTPTATPSATPTPTPTPSPTPTQTTTPTTPTSSAPANRPPTANTDSVRTQEGQTLRFRPTDNDTDPDGDTLVVVSITQPEGGTASEFSNQITYEPDVGFTGYDSLTYEISDGEGGTDTGVVQIFVEDNLPPTANDDQATTVQDMSVVIDVLRNDDDPEGDTLTVASFTQSLNGTVSRSGDDLRFTPDPGYSGTAFFDYTVQDELGQSDTATVAVTVEASNMPPTANNDSATVLRGGSVNINVTANDSDPDGDPLTIEIVTLPSQGSVQVVDDTTVQYSNDARSTAGSDSFTYRVVDSSGEPSNTATVSITINTAPIARDDSVSTFSDTVSFNVITGSGTQGGTKNADSDPDGDRLAIDPISLTFRDVEGGTLSCNAGGGCTWDPAPDCNGVTVTVNYTLRDGRGGTDTGTMTLSASTIC